MKWSDKTQKKISATFWWSIFLLFIFGLIQAVGFLHLILFIIGTFIFLIFIGGCMWLIQYFSHYDDEYQRWFAWRPVRFWHGGYAWFQTVERRRTGDLSAFYQEIGYKR